MRDTTRPFNTALPPLLFGILLGVSISTGLAQQSGVVTVAQIKGGGTAEVVADGQRTAVNKGEEITLPTRIETGGARVAMITPAGKIGLGQKAICDISASGRARMRRGNIIYEAPDGGVQNLEFLNALVETSSLAIAHAPPPGSEGFFKLMLFQGEATLNVAGESEITLKPNQMTIIRTDGERLFPDQRMCSDFDIELAVETSDLINGFDGFWDTGKIDAAVETFRTDKRNGKYVSFPRQQVRRGVGDGARERRFLARLIKPRVRPETSPRRESPKATLPPTKSPSKKAPPKK